MRSPRQALIALFTVAGLGSALPAAAQFQKPEDAVKYRKAGFTLMAAHFGRIGAMAQGRVPFDAAAATANADLAVSLSRLPFAGFVDGTAGSGKGSAKAEIWTERAEFDGKAKKMQEEMNKLAVAARANNLDQLKAAFGSAAASCKACHDNYRND